MTIRLSRIYTRAGDGGEPHLGDRSRVPKTHPRIEAYGDVDELCSQIGVAMGLQLAKAVKAVPMAEDDRSTCDVLVAEGYQFHNGSYTVPREPGLGIRIDEKIYTGKYKNAEISVS